MKLAGIRIDGGTQSRVEINQMAVADYAEALTEGAKLPAVIVFFDGVDHWLADGFHRYHAHRKIDAREIDAEVRQGTQRDAVLFSVGANATHGLRRSNADKRKAVETLLADAEWATWSDREIGRRAGVHHKTVSEYRASLADSASEPSAERTYTTKHGTVAKMDTSGIGKQAAAPVDPPAEPPAPAPSTPPAPPAVVQAAQAAAAAVEAPTLPAEPAPVSAAEPEDMDDDGPTMDEIVADLQADNARLSAIVESVKDGDQAAQTVKWAKLAQQAERRRDEALAVANKAQSHGAFLKKQLDRCGRAVDESDPDRIAATVEAFVRAHRRPS